MIPSGVLKIAFAVSIIKKNSNTIEKHHYLQSLNTKKTDISQWKYKPLAGVFSRESEIINT